MGKRSADPELAEAAFRAMVRAWGLIRRVMQPVFQDHGVSASQWGVLRTLHRAEREGAAGLHLTDLGDRLLVRPPSITGVVGRLERMGLLVRKTSATDLRAKEVRLTPAGKGLLGRMTAAHRMEVRAVLGGLAPSEQAQLCVLLERLASHLERLARDGTNSAGPASGRKTGNSA